MSRAMCPGQDTRFWKPGDVFEAACGKCGYAVEFFKDDAARRCTKCGQRIQNPKLSLGCAQWCEHAQECLGFDPQAMPVVNTEEITLADRLIEAMKAEFGDDQKRITHALQVFEHAQVILNQEKKGDPKVVFAAALLHDIGIQEAERKHGSSAGKYQEIEGPPIARRIMERLGLDEPTIEHVCQIVGHHHSDLVIDTPEFRIIWDADWLVNLAEEAEGWDADRLTGAIERIFRTQAGREKAAKLYLQG